jgi:hypothetical protein
VTTPVVAPVVTPVEAPVTSPVTTPVEAPVEAPVELTGGGGLPVVSAPLPVSAGAGGGAITPTTLPFTGAQTGELALLGIVVLTAGVGATALGRPRRSV